MLIKKISGILLGIIYKSHINLFFGGLVQCLLSIYAFVSKVVLLTKLI